MAIMPINDLVRILKMLHTINSGTIYGRIHLQKMVYLIKQLSIKHNPESKPGFNFDFDFYNYGVFSKTLAKNVTYLSDETSYLSEEEPIGEYSPWKYTVNIDLETERDFPSSEELFGLENTVLDKNANELARASGKELECISTIVYLANEIDGFKYTSETNSIEFEKLKNKVIELKPHVSDVFDDSYKIAKDYVIN